MREPWQSGDTPEEQTARSEAYRRLAGAAQRVGVPLESLHGLLRQVLHNEEETRRFLAEQVYHVPDEHLDEWVRVRLVDLEREPGPDDPAS